MVLVIVTMEEQDDRVLSLDSVGSNLVVFFGDAGKEHYIQGRMSSSQIFSFSNAPPIKPGKNQQKDYASSAKMIASFDLLEHNLVSKTRETWQYILRFSTELNFR